MKCSICSRDIDVQINGWDQGHSAYPVNEGRCCTLCNVTEVIPERISRLAGDPEEGSSAE